MEWLVLLARSSNSLSLFFARKFVPEVAPSGPPIFQAMYASANETMVPARFMLMVTHLIATLTVLYDSSAVAHKSGADDFAGARSEYVKSSRHALGERSSTHTD